MYIFGRSKSQKIFLTSAAYAIKNISKLFQIVIPLYDYCDFTSAV